VWRLGTIFLASMLLVGCGGGGGGSTAATPTPTPTTSSTNAAPTGAGGSQLPSPSAVNVGAGQAVSGIDVAVVTPSGSNAPNAQNLGVNPLTGRASASNTGGEIHRGGSNRIVLFGPGLNGQMTVRISGPADVSTTNIVGIQATDNTPGLAFTATASGNAALGARTVYLQNANGDVTAFAGSMEVIP
jgi:hypothetical protein